MLAQFRRELWDHLNHFPAITNEPWIVGGDFNSIRFPGEKMGGRLQRMTFVKTSVIGFIIMGCMICSLRAPDSHGHMVSFQSALIELFATRLGSHSILTSQSYIF